MCNMKTMIKIAVGIGLLLIVGYVLFPQFQVWIAAAVPYLLFLICPLAMFFMMRGMNSPQEKEKEKKSNQDDK